MCCPPLPQNTRWNDVRRGLGIWRNPRFLLETSSFNNFQKSASLLFDSLPEGPYTLYIFVVVRNKERLKDSRQQIWKRVSKALQMYNRVLNMAGVGKININNDVQRCGRGMKLLNYFLMNSEVKSRLSFSF